jgi:two-component sensor histidine kinase
MSIEKSQMHADAPVNVVFPIAADRTAASYERELVERRNTEARLREEIAQDEKLLRQKDELIGEQALINQESNHRLLNDLQIVASLLSLQSRKSAHAEVASQLIAAASRIATIARVHQRLHSIDGAQSLALKPYLVDFCRDFSTLLGTNQAIAVEGIDIELPRATGIPLSLIVNELITNAVKYGTGRITVSIETNPEKGYAVSVSNDGPALPEGFDPTASKGQGMRIIRSFVDRIGGELRIGRRDNEQGARFTVLFG